MKKQLLAAVVVLIFCLPFVLGFGSSAPKPVSQAEYPYLVDNFEDGDTENSPEWFKFDNVKVKAEKNTNKKEGEAKVVETIGAYSLSLKGSTTKWYVGGMGVMLGINANKYKSVEVDVYGNGENSGRIKIELYDDDNGNKDIEVLPNWTPKYDDLWISETEVNWKGWKHLSLPFSSFTLANAGYGDGKFNPELTGNSGGLVKLQLIFVANKETGEINFSVDNLELGN
jgi:hypothetical protein